MASEAKFVYIERESDLDNRYIDELFDAGWRMKLIQASAENINDDHTWYTTEWAIYLEREVDSP